MTNILPKSNRLLALAVALGLVLAWYYGLLSHPKALFSNAIGSLERAQGSEPSQAAVAGQSNPGAPPISAHEWMRRARKGIESYGSLAARLKHRVNLVDPPLSGNGSYLQGSAHSKLLRLEMRLQAGSQIGSLLQVCDGKQQWTQRELFGESRLMMIDLERVARAKPDAGDLANLGLGGLPKLLQRLDEGCDFKHGYAARLGDFAVQAIEGRWRKESLALLLPEPPSSEQAIDLAMLPLHVPDHVVLFLGSDDAFPYRIEFRRSADGKLPENSPASQSAGRILVSMDLFEVRFNPRLDALQFVHHPGNLPVVDLTDGYLH